MAVTETRKSAVWSIAWCAALVVVLVTSVFYGCRMHASYWDQYDKYISQLVEASGNRQKAIEMFLPSKSDTAVLAEQLDDTTWKYYPGSNAPSESYRDYRNGQMFMLTQYGVPVDVARELADSTEAQEDAQHDVAGSKLGSNSLLYSSESLEHSREAVRLARLVKK